MTLDQLQVLAAVRRTGSVSAAAVQLHRAQSAVSYALKTLEGDLELALIDHSGYRARLTPVGETVLAKAEAVLAGVDDLERLAAELRGGREPTLSLLVDAILPIDRALAVLTPLSGAESPTRIDLRVELLGGMVRALQDEPALVLSTLGLFQLPASYVSDVVGSIAMVSVVAPSHPLAALPAPVPLEAARRHVHLLITSPPGFQVPVDSGLIGASRHWSFPDFHSRLAGLRAGLGFAWMPVHLVEADLHAGRLAPLVLEYGSLQSHDVALIYRTRPQLGPTGRFVLERLREHPQLLPAPHPDLLRMYDLP